MAGGGHEGFFERGFLHPNGSRSWSSGLRSGNDAKLRDRSATYSSRISRNSSTRSNGFPCSLLA